MAQPILMSTKLDKHSAIQPTKSTCSPTRVARDYKMTDAYTLHTNSARRGVGCGGRAQLNNGLGESRDLAVFLFFSSSRTGMF